MQLQVEPIGINQNFNGLKFKPKNIQPKKNISQSGDLERKMSTIGWGILFAGLLLGVAEGGKAFFDSFKANEGKKNIHMPEQIEIRKSAGGIYGNVCKVFKDSAGVLKTIK